MAKTTFSRILLVIGILLFVCLSHAADKGKSDGKAPAKGTTPSISPKAAPKVAPPIESNLEQRGDQLFLKWTRDAEVKVWAGGRLVQICKKKKGEGCNVTKAAEAAGSGNLKLVWLDADENTGENTVPVGMYAHLFKADKPESPSIAPPSAPAAPKVPSMAPAPSGPTPVQPPVTKKAVPPTAFLAKPNAAKEPFVSIEEIFLKSDVVWVKLKNTGKGDLSPQDYASGILSLNLGKEQKSLRLIQLDPKSELNRGKSVEFDTGIKMTQRATVKAYIANVGGDKMKGTSLVPMESLKPKAPIIKMEPTAPSPHLKSVAKAPEIKAPKVEPSKSIAKAPSKFLAKPLQTLPGTKGPGEERGIDVLEPLQGSYQTKGFPIHIVWNAHGDGCVGDRPFQLILISDSLGINWPCGTVPSGASDGDCIFPYETSGGRDYYVRVIQGDACRGDSWDFEIGLARDIGADDSLPPGTADLGIIEPTGVPTWYQGTGHRIRWRVYPTHFPARVGWDINIRRDGAPLTGDMYNMYYDDTRRPDFNIGSRTYSIPWTVPEDAEPGCGYTVRVFTMDHPYGAVALLAENNFCIAEPIVAEPIGTLTVLTPASSGTTHFITEPLTINWTSTADIGNVRIKLMRDGSEFETLASNEPRTGSFLWRIGYSDSTLGSSACSDAALIGALGGGAARRFQIRIESRSHPEIFGEGPEFNISMPTITVTQPSGNPRIGCGGTLGIVWESSGLWGDINLEAWRPGGGGPYHVIQENIDRFLGHYDWRVWGCPSVWEGSLDEPYNIDLKIRVRSTSCHDVYGESTGTFRVTD